MEQDSMETERLGRAMAARARTRPEFIGYAMELWEAANAGCSIADVLRCGEEQLWRLAVTPRPTGIGLTEASFSLAADLDVNPAALVNILRFAESAQAFAGANDDGEMLMAALDRDADEEDRER
ncbi:hypothetical protein [Sphingopyxis sp. Root1497]|uniref:hypothetical protein n=1 Tax=Sphingopyxis sp. Root1497 TaxID=1736474 RepID=UPI0006F32DCE|nr:hypothetical protein [Sphingopyxis sp. Root1497]